VNARFLVPAGTRAGAACGRASVPPFVLGRNSSRNRQPPTDSAPSTPLVLRI